MAAEVELAERLPEPARSGSVVVPLSFGEERLWFLHELAGDSPVYSVPLASRLRGPLDPDALADAFRAVGARHETLRASFDSHLGVPVKLVHPEPIGSLERLGQQDRPDEILSELSRLPFDLTAPPLLRAYLLTLGRNDHLLFVNAHHIAVDGWSIGVLNAELAATYASLLAERPPDLPELAIQYADFAAWERDRAHQDRYSDELAFWTDRLRALPHPLDFGDGTKPDRSRGSAGRRHTFSIGPELLGSARRASREAGVTLFAFMLAAFQLLLSTRTGAKDIVVGVPVGDRPTPETEQLIGFFVNTVAVRVHVDPNEAAGMQLRATQAALTDALAHAEVPFQHVVQAIRGELPRGASEPFNAMFGLEATSLGLDLPGIEETPESVDNGTAKFDISMLIEERASEALGHIEYRTDALDVRQARSFRDDYLRLLTRLTRSQPAERQWAIA